MPISVGEGKQCIYWLAVNAVQRYVMDENSYTRTFSEELTPKAVLDTQLLQIDNKARIKDELQDGAHVWVDVGDGVPISEVNSRPFELQPETGDEVADQEVSWELDPEDKRLVMRYQRSTSKAHLSFEQWRMTSQKQFLDDYQDPSADDQAENPLYETFKTCWKQIRLSDIPGYPDWLSEVQALLWRHFEQLSWVFSVHACRDMSAGESKAAWSMSLGEFWTFCKKRRIPSPWLNMAKIDLVFLHIDARSKEDPHNPRRAFNLAEFVEGIVRLSVLRHKDPRNLGMPVSEALEEFLEKHVLNESAEFVQAQRVRAILNQPMCKRVYTQHTNELRRIFKHFTKQSNTGTMSLAEWQEVIKLSNLNDASFQKRQTLEVFVHAQLDQGVQTEELLDSKDTCETMIFTEFEEALGRAALIKYAEDTITPAEGKLHELLELLIASPAGVASKARPSTSKNDDEDGLRRARASMRRGALAM